ncbi:DUF1878 family protein [Ornithinibacillus contaminans]|uniref:DUF1878 family protein n=1 Tax=Ornithinibacillus contaminans TaxID=694055 RepID=UPI00064DAEC3|nr:DUF1878 family protein [Ornithinibacillus contaminans]
MCDDNKLAAFHVQLLLKTIDSKQYPFTKLIIEQNITNEEYDSMFQMLEAANQEYMEQKEEGLLNYSSLLLRFVGMLNKKLEATETIHALRAEGYFPELMEEFIKLIQKEQLL